VVKNHNLGLSTQIWETSSLAPYQPHVPERKSSLFHDLHHLYLQNGDNCIVKRPKVPKMWINDNEEHVMCTFTGSEEALN
jgi:hypothetical protein